MRKKQLWSIISALICVMLLLAGCGNGGTDPADTKETQPGSTTEDPGETEKHTYTLEEIRANYQLEQILKQYNCVGYETKSFYGDKSEPTSESCSQFQVTESGIQMDEYAKCYDGTSYKQGRISDEYPGAFYMIAENGSKGIAIYPEDKYAAALDKNWILDNLYENDEVFVDCVYRDGIAVVTTTVDLSDTYECIDTIEYHIEPKTDKLVYVEISSSYEDIEFKQIRKVTFVYDKPLAMEKEPCDEIITEQNYCEVNVIFDYMTDKQSTQWFPVSDGTSVLVNADGTGYKLYSDAAMTEKYDMEDAVAGKSMNIFAVKE